MGVQRESGSLPLVEAGAETPAVVQDAEVLAVGCKGRGEPFARWVQGEPQSPWRDATARVAPAGCGLDAPSGRAIP